MQRHPAFRCVSKRPFSSFCEQKNRKKATSHPFFFSLFHEKTCTNSLVCAGFRFGASRSHDPFFCHFSLHHLPHLPTYFTYFPRSPARPDLQSSRSEYKDFQSAYTVHFAFVTPWVFRIANAYIRFRRILAPFYYASVTPLGCRAANPAERGREPISLSVPPCCR